jgi:hypothetical protein
MTNDNAEPVMGRGLLNLWWERDCMQRRQKMAPVYPLPYDGASFAVLNNNFAKAGMWDERHGSKERLSALCYLARNTITERFLELWPKIPATIHAAP